MCRNILALSDTFKVNNENINRLSNKYHAFTIGGTYIKKEQVLEGLQLGLKSIMCFERLNPLKR